jgi:PAS domain S-box-containing protein
MRHSVTGLARRSVVWAAARLQRLARKLDVNPSAQPSAKTNNGVLTDDETKFLALSRNVPGLVWIKDHRGRYQFVNSVAEAALGRSSAQWIGKSDSDIFPIEAAEQFVHNDRQVLTSGQSLFCTEWMPMAGAVRYMMTSRFPIRSDGQTLIGGIAIDITDAVRTEREIAHLRHNLFAGEPTRSIVELSSIIGHDLNNTLNAVMLRMSLFTPASPDSEQEANAARIERLVDRAAASVRRLQEFANAQRPFSDATDIDEMLREEVRILENANSFPSAIAVVKPELNITANKLPKVMGNAGEVRYVITTLLRNAQEAMPAGGTIRVDAHVNATKVIVTVADEGLGISEDRLTNIFDPFFTTKATLGSGLGLSGSFGIMSRLGGTIAAANRPEGGATFTLNFPIFTDVTAANISMIESSTKDEPTIAARQRILVIDDDIDTLEAMKEALEGRGYEVETAPDGQKGLELLRTSAFFDSVICDVGMPIMNGWDVAQEITRVAPSTRVYMLTGWANEIPQSDPRRAQVAAVIAKPISVEQIDAAIARKH